MPIGSMIAKFRDEFEQHIEQARIRSGLGAGAPEPALAAGGIVLSFLYTGSAMATTAIGTLIPILRDNGELKTKFGTYLLAAGGAGEFGPIEPALSR